MVCKSRFFPWTSALERQLCARLSYTESHVPHFFFDVHDGAQNYDNEGVPCADLKAAAKQADALLPEIAYNRVARDSERQIITVLVRDEEGHPVYHAALSQVGTWLIR